MLLSSDFLGLLPEKFASFFFLIGKFASSVGCSSCWIFSIFVMLLQICGCYG